MSRNSPQPKVQTRAKRARIQSQRPLSPESTLIASSPLNKPLEASVPTVPLLPPGPAWKHGDLGPSNITVVEHVNPKATDHQTVTRDGVSDIIERANQEKLQLERHNLERKTGGETERAKQEQKRIELQNLENEKMRELEKTRQEVEELASHQRLSKMDKELQELRDQVSKLKIQQHSPLPLTTVHAPTSSKPDSSSHQRVSHSLR